MTSPGCVHAHTHVTTLAFSAFARDSYLPKDSATGWDHLTHAAYVMDVMGMRLRWFNKMLYKLQQQTTFNYLSRT